MMEMLVQIKLSFQERARVRIVRSRVGGVVVNRRYEQNSSTPHDNFRLSNNAQHARDSFILGQSRSSHQLRHATEIDAVGDTNMVVARAQESVFCRRGLSF